jgi:hypothetical protein
MLGKITNLSDAVESHAVKYFSVHGSELTHIQHGITLTNRVRLRRGVGPERRSKRHYCRCR